MWNLGASAAIRLEGLNRSGGAIARKIGDTRIDKFTGAERMIRKSRVAPSLCCALLCAFQTAMFAADGNNNGAAASVPAATQPAADKTSDQIAELKAMLANQQRQIEELQRSLAEQKKMLQQSTGASAKPDAARPDALAPANAHKSLGEVASTTPIIPSGRMPDMPAAPAPASEVTLDQNSSLQMHVGSATIAPVGFVDFTNVWRSTNPGSGIGTNFGSIPFKTATQGNIAEDRMSLQNSRIGARIDAIVKGAHVIGYWESDFLGPAPGNVTVSSNSDVFRLRLYWVDVRKNAFEFLGGQSWSLLTPGRTGISPLPGDLFYTQDMDVNYQAGLVWTRQPQFRMVYHPNSKVAAAVSFEAPNQYIGGSGGGGVVTLPSALSTPYGSQFDAGSGGFSTPNAGPDIVAKVAFDPTKKFHFEVGGVLRNFRAYNPLVNQHFSATGGGFVANLNFQLFKGFRLLTNNYWSDGGGRYIFGLAPDLIARSDGSFSLVHASSTVSGFEYTHKNTLFYGYYGGVYIGRNVAVDSTGKLVGYGYTGSSNGQNRAIQEGTFGIIQTFWKDPRYGALSFISQYSYLTRNPWFVAAGAPANAATNMVFLDLRYTLPGAAPAMVEK